MDVMLASKEITAIKVGLTKKGLFILPKTSRARDYYTLIESRNKNSSLLLSLPNIMINYRTSNWGEFFPSIYKCIIVGLSYDKMSLLKADVGKGKKLMSIMNKTLLRRIEISYFTLPVMLLGKDYTC